jgi:hypothetical protein
MPDRATADIAAIVWLRTLADLPTGTRGGVASTLPDNPATVWPDGFVVVDGTVGGPGLSSSHRRRDRLLLTTHYVTPNSSRPRWHRSAELGEIIVEATLANNWEPLHLTPDPPLDAYPAVYIHHARIIGGPFRAIGDPGNHARHRLTLELDWHQ